MKPNRSPLKKHWSFDPDVIFLNHGSFGATPNQVMEEQTRIRAHLESDPVRFFEREAFGLMNEASEKLSDFLNADSDGMTFCQNATSGVNTVLRSLTLNRGDEIIIPNHSYQACWNAIDFVASRWGAKVVVVDLPFRCDSEEEIIEPLLGAITPRTVLAMIDTVTSPTGLRMPFEKLVEEFQLRGVDVLLDAAHGPGIVPMDLAKLDVAWVTGNCHKWLCSPKGSAFLHIREDKKKETKPLTISHGHSADLSSQEKFRFEFDWQGTRDLTAILCIPKSIETLKSIVSGGFDEIMEHNNSLALKARNLLCESLGTDPPTPDSMISAMATIDLPGTYSGGADIMGDPLHNKLLDEFSIQVPVFPWPHHKMRYFRISAYLYNAIEEYEYLAEILQDNL
tara:strand:- start:17937 stop:19121 length:1185 start_codon:yes stop_codon:yes gene_type:complete